MEQRPQQPPHPFSRNTASPYNRTPFPPASTQAAFPPASHAPTASPAYNEHQRRPSDPPFYSSQRVYGQDGPSMAGPGHARHQSASSIGHGTPVNRTMPPPSSPQQERHPGYLPPRQPIPGGPAPFSRELPALGQRSGMSISDILGGPPAPPREQGPQYGSPVATTGTPSASIFGSSRGSPRNQSTGPDYAPFRRPQTPEHQRFSGPRDHRANSAGSPPNPSIFGTPENRQLNTPYRGSQVPEDRRDIRGSASTSVPPRPNSQPNSFNPSASRAQDSRLTEFARRMDQIGRPPEPPNRAEPPYQRPSFGDRHDPRFSYADRERQEREAEQRERDREREAALQRERDIQREREIREQREIRERAEQERQQEYAQQLAQRNAQAYSRAPEREQPAWMRPQPPYDQPRAAYEPSERPPPHTSGYEYSGSTAPQYGGHPAYTPSEPRYSQASHPPSHHGAPATQYDQSSQDQQMRIAQVNHQERQHQAMYGGSGPAPYASHESPARRTVEEAQQMQQQKSFLGIQEINRKGRLSPLPQAVQGAQSQINGPGGEPSIKNEFGRMFSGIGSGVGAMGAPSPIGMTPQNLPFAGGNQLRRDEADSLQNSPVENGSHKMSRNASLGGSRRRKLKEEDSRGEEDSAGRNTPSGRGKRAKTHHHHHHHHHHHRPDPHQESTMSPSITPFKNARGAAVPSPPGPEKETPTLHHHHVPVSRPHHHHHHVTPKPAPQVNPQIPLPNVTIVSTAVLDSVKERPRKHLGHCYYDATLKRSGTSINGIKKGSQGYSSTPKPLPLFEESDYNCLFTVKVPRVHVTRASLQEITNRKALWGTDIYTDDSDVVAAAIHAGWFRGAWDDSVDVALLGLELPGKAVPKVYTAGSKDEVLDRPPPTGPADIPNHHDVHITIVILPLLEGYSSTIRFGIKSREWGFKREGYQSQHDGLSFMIQNVAFVLSEVGGSGVRTRKKIALQKSQTARTSQERQLIELLNLKETGPQFKESFERGSGAPVVRGDMMGVGTKNWWKKAATVVKETTPQIKEKEKEVEEPIVGDSREPETAAAAPRTPPPQEALRHYGPIDPPIPSPISVIDPQADIERVTEMAESANVTPSKTTADAAVPEEVISPPRPVPDVVSSPPAPIVRQESQREVLGAGHRFGDQIEVKRETIDASPPLLVQPTVGLTATPVEAVPNGAGTLVKESQIEEEQLPLIEKKEEQGGEPDVAKVNTELGTQPQAKDVGGSSEAAAVNSQGM